jgi:RNA polymerase sigma-70 factor, ECF subfamily
VEQHLHNEKCREVFALLSDYLNLELPPDACQDIEVHIAGCPPCIAFADSLRKTVDLCRRYQPTELPAPIGQEAKAQLLEAYRRMLAMRRGSKPG